MGCERNRSFPQDAGSPLGSHAEADMLFLGVNDKSSLSGSGKKGTELWVSEDGGGRFQVESDTQGEMLAGAGGQAPPRTPTLLSNFATF